MSVTGLNASSAFDGAANKKKFDPKDLLVAFEQQLDESGCSVVDWKNPSSASTPAMYSAFFYSPGQGERTFDNTMKLSQGKPKAESMVSRWHEGFHAIDTSNVLAAHFTPYNMGGLNIVLSPQSFIKYIRLTERKAMAGAAMLGYIEGSDEMRKALSKEAATFEDFEEALKAYEGDFEAALNRVARQCLVRPSNELMVAWGDRKESEPVRLYNYYIWQALKEYSSSNRFIFGNQLHDYPSPIFCRLSTEDILAIGNILGFSAFGAGKPDSYFTDGPQLMIKHQRWLDGQNVTHAVPPENELPTVKEALSMFYGMTPDEALLFSKNYRQGEPWPEAKGPDASKLAFIPLG